LTFRDHHWFTAHDLARITERALGAQADLIVTTEKDAVRLAPLLGRARLDAHDGAGPAWMVLPMRADVEPADAFAAWILSAAPSPGAGSSNGRQDHA
jgi:tetraacyldisaccharide 4'-kinase